MILLGLIDLIVGKITILSFSIFGWLVTIGRLNIVNFYTLIYIFYHVPTNHIYFLVDTIVNEITYISNFFYGRHNC